MSECVFIFKNSQSQFIWIEVKFLCVDARVDSSRLIVVKSNREFVDPKPNHNHLASVEKCDFLPRKPARNSSPADQSTDQPTVERIRINYLYYELRRFEWWWTLAWPQRKRDANWSRSCSKWNGCAPVSCERRLNHCRLRMRMMRNEERQQSMCWFSIKWHIT